MIEYHENRKSDERHPAPVTLGLYNIFHLNLGYSAIEEADRTWVIERCYWPLLRLAARYDLPFGIELSCYTLETIAAIAPEWITEFRRLITDGHCELIGSGYAQIIGPLVPPAVTAANLRMGHAVYRQLLGVRPIVALLNEQAFSAGLVPLYVDAGYSAIIMEWNNPAREHPEWDPEWRYLPQRAFGTGIGTAANADPKKNEEIGLDAGTGPAVPSANSEINLIWNKSIGFQKFQRYAHGELELEEMLAYVRSHLSDHPRAFPLYGNDVEIFDFRPGRYMTEAGIQQEGEWNRIDALYAALLREPGMRFIRPSEVLRLRDRPGAQQRLCLSSAAQPIPVKKQDKYNVVRWAVTGRDDLGINTTCRQILAAMQRSQQTNDADWKELCYLWSSDFRTHITEKRWVAYRRRLQQVAARWGDGAAQAHSSAALGRPALASRALEIQREGRFLNIRGERLALRLNCYRGLALDCLVDRAYSDQPFCGTLHHGHFDDIRWGADYYSGHLVFESPGRAKVTDLSAVEPRWQYTDEGLCVSARIATPMGAIEKSWMIDDTGGRVRLRQHLDWPEPVLGSLRFAHVTLLDNAFDAGTLHYRTHNGGAAPETFMMAGRAVDHGRPVSFLVSANQAVGMTDGLLELGDHRHRVRVRCNPDEAAVVGLITHQQVMDQHFTRMALSARELDDTSKPAALGQLCLTVEISAQRSEPGT